MDVDYGYLPYATKQSDTRFSNNLLKSFYPIAIMYTPSKSLFWKYFIQEKCRQWEIHKQMSKLTKSFHFLQSENPQLLEGRQIEEGYIPKPNDVQIAICLIMHL